MYALDNVNNYGRPLKRTAIYFKVWEYKPFPATWNVLVIPNCRPCYGSLTHTCLPVARVPAECTSRKRGSVAAASSCD